MAGTSCTRCNIEFDRVSSEKYCPDCKYIKVACSFCGRFKMLERIEYDSQVRHGQENFYCDQSCSSKHTMSKRKRQGTVVRCDYCGKPKYVFPSRLKDHQLFFCDRNCADKFRRQNPQAMNCIGLNSEQAKKAAATRKKRGTNIFSKLIGPKNPRWSGGKIYYRGPSWYSQRKKAMMHDGMLCVVCGEVIISVHHIIPFRRFKFDADSNRNDKWANHLDNLICLCFECHARAERTQNKNLPEQRVKRAKQYFAGVKDKL